MTININVITKVDLQKQKKIHLDKSKTSVMKLKFLTFGKEWCIAWKRKKERKRKKEKSLSCVRLFATPWTIAYQASQSMEFSRQEYWSGLPFPSPGDLPNSGIESAFPALQADALPSEPPGKIHCLENR